MPAARIPHLFNTGTGKRRLPNRTTTTIMNSTAVKNCSMPCYTFLPGLPPGLLIYLLFTRDNIAVRPLSATETRRHRHAVRVTEHICRGLQRRPYGSDRKTKLTIYFLGHGHYSKKFADRYLEKKIWEKISPWGVRPPNFLQKHFFLPYGNVPVQLHCYKSKTVACSAFQK